MTTLEDLYYGNISPYEMYIKRGTRVDKLVKLIRQKAVDAGMSITDYIILCAIDKKVINYDGLRELTTQVKKLGNNVNQLLILSRQGRIDTVNLTAKRS